MIYVLRGLWELAALLSRYASLLLITDVISLADRNFLQYSLILMFPTYACILDIHGSWPVDCHPSYMPIA